MAMDSRWTDGQLAVETMTDSWRKKQERVGRRTNRQMDGRGGIDGQPAVETATDSQWTLRKTKVDKLMDGHTDR